MEYDAIPVFPYPLPVPLPLFTFEKLTLLSVIRFYVVYAVMDLHNGVSFDVEIEFVLPVTDNCRFVTSSIIERCVACFLSSLPNRV